RVEVQAGDAHSDALEVAVHVEEGQVLRGGVLGDFFALARLGGQLHDDRRLPGGIAGAPVGPVPRSARETLDLCRGAAHRLRVGPAELAGVAARCRSLEATARPSMRVVDISL